MAFRNMLAKVYLCEAFQFNIPKRFGELLLSRNWQHKDEVFVYLDKSTGDVVFTKNYAQAKRNADGEICTVPSHPAQN